MLYKFWRIRPMGVCGSELWRLHLVEARVFTGLATAVLCKHLFYYLWRIRLMEACCTGSDVCVPWQCVRYGLWRIRLMGARVLLTLAHPFY